MKHRCDHGAIRSISGEPEMSQRRPRSKSYWFCIVSGFQVFGKLKFFKDMAQPRPRSAARRAACAFRFLVRGPAQRFAHTAVPVARAWVRVSWQDGRGLEWHQLLWFVVLAEITHCAPIRIPCKTHCPAVRIISIRLISRENNRPLRTVFCIFSCVPRAWKRSHRTLSASNAE